MSDSPMDAPKELPADSAHAHEHATVTVEEVGPSRKRLQVEIAAPTVQAEVDRAFAQVGRQARLPGFRPGKAPRRVLERTFGEQIRRDVLGRLIEDSFHHAVHDHQLAVVGTPEIDADALKPGEGLRYSATVDVRPTIVLGELGGLDIVRPSSVVSDDEVERVLGSLRESVAQLRPITDRQVVESGDVVTLNLSSVAGRRRADTSRRRAPRGRGRELPARTRAPDRRTAPRRAPLARRAVSGGLPESVAGGTLRALRGRGRGPAREGAAAAGRRVRTRSRSQRHARGAARTHPRRPRAPGDRACRWRGA